MESFLDINIGKPHAGANIYDTCKEACEIAERTRNNFYFTFNDTKLVAYPGCQSQALVAKYFRERG